MAKRSATEDVRLTLGVLSAAEVNDALSQRSLAAELGVALGLVNAYINRCVRKGLLKVSQVPARRYRYYLTPAGFAEKAKLTGEYLAISLTFFRKAKAGYSQAFSRAEAKQWKSVALLGAGDLADIAIICAMESGVSVTSIVDPSAEAHSTRIPIVKDYASIPHPVDGFIWTGLPLESLGQEMQPASASNILVPNAELLGLHRAIGMAGKV